MFAGKRRLFAKGRLKSGEMNKTEAAYAQFLESEKQAGRVAAYWFESMKLKIADGKCWLTPDFLILRPDGSLELHDTKGSPAVFMDDAKVKMKVAASQYPFPVFVVYPRPKKDGGGWTYEEY